MNSLFISISSEDTFEALFPSLLQTSQWSDVIVVTPHNEVLYLHKVRWVTCVGGLGRGLCLGRDLVLGFVSEY